MATEKTFTVAGTSVYKGVMTFRFANGEPKNRMWVLKHNEHTDINLIALEKAMTKADAAAFLIANNHPGADVAIVPGGSSKGKTAEQIAAEEAARAAAEALRKKNEYNEKRRLARANAKAKAAENKDANFIDEAAGAAEPSDDATVPEATTVPEAE